MIKQLRDKISKNQSISMELLKYKDFEGLVYIGKYKLLNFLKKQSLANVFKAIDNGSSREVIIKYINKEEVSQTNKDMESLQKLKKLLIDQEQIMQKCHSAFIIKLLQTFQNDKCKVFVMEHCEDGTLEDFIVKKQSLEQSMAIQILRQIVLALTELHMHNVILRDLKPQNILQQKGLFKIDLSGQYFNQQEKGKNSKSTLNPLLLNEQQYGSKTDIRSLGLIYFLMIYPNFSYAKKYDILYKMITNNQNFYFQTIKNQLISKQSTLFLKQTLQSDQDKRLNWQQLLQHPIFKKKNEKLSLIYIPYASSNKLSPETKNEKSQYFITQKQQINLKQTLINSPNPQLKDYLNIQKINELYLECRKSQFILQQMIYPIQSKRLLNFKERSHIQLLFLLISRCRENVIYSKQIIKSAYPNDIYQDFLQKIQNIQPKINKKFQQYSLRLKTMQDKVFSILSDKFQKLFKKQEYIQKQKYLNSFQRINFTKSQQILFTLQKYLINIINELEGNQHDEEQMKNKFKCYKKINQLEMKDLYDQDIKSAIQKIINQIA